MRRVSLCSDEWHSACLQNSHARCRSRSRVRSIFLLSLEVLCLFWLVWLAVFSLSPALSLSLSLFRALSRALSLSRSLAVLPFLAPFLTLSGGQHSMYTALCLYRSLLSVSEFFFSGQNLVTQLHRRCHFFIYTRAQQFHNAMRTRDHPLCWLEK